MNALQNFSYRRNLIVSCNIEQFFVRSFSLLRFKFIKINFLQVVCVLNGFFVLVVEVYARIGTLRIEFTFEFYTQSFFSTHYLQFLTLLFLPQFFTVFFLSLITSPSIVLCAGKV